MRATVVGCVVRGGAGGLSGCGRCVCGGAGCRGRAGGRGGFRGGGGDGLGVRGSGGVRGPRLIAPCGGSPSGLL
ncbi:MAG: hypothetical protein ACRD1S_05160, partial [Vicinamibacterales bacterium]